jgi:hypothetical protein
MSKLQPERDAIDRIVIALRFLFEHRLSGKPLRAFRIVR